MKLFIIKTQAMDIDAVVAMENDIENAEFIFSNSTEEHLDLLRDDDIAPLVLKSENAQTIGFVVLAGLKDKNESIEFCRIVINQKGKGYGRKAIQKIKRYCFKN
jgi:hypothetical protein